MPARLLDLSAAKKLLIVNHHQQISMGILTMNCGSSTLKFDLFEFTDESSSSTTTNHLAWGIIDRIGNTSGSSLDFNSEAGSRESKDVILNHEEAARAVLEWLESSQMNHSINAIGHRIVHGGRRFIDPTIIDEVVIKEIEKLKSLAPLHNNAALQAIHACRKKLGARMPMVGVFDTAFFRRIPTYASMYAIPLEIASKHHIQRYGFHGIAHRSMTEYYASFRSIQLDEVNVITLHLGAGCSAAAVLGGYPVDTSMGFTPLEGLMMGTRSGDLDPSLVAYISHQESLRVDDVEKVLNKSSGLLGVSGRSADIRELLHAEGEGDKRSALAVEMFCYRVRKYIGAYLAVLGGAQAVIFGGGIGENSAEVRARICRGMEWCGMLLDPERNLSPYDFQGQISREESPIRILAVRVNEGSVIANDTRIYVTDQRLAERRNF